MRTREEITEALSKAIARRKEADEEVAALDAELKLLDEIPALPTYPEGTYYYHTDRQFNVGLNKVGKLNSWCWNVFPTKEYAKEFANRVILLAKLFHCKWYLDRDYKPDWKKKEFKYSIVYLEEEGKFSVNTLIYSDTCTVCFSTQEIAERAAAWMNEHALNEVRERK